MVELVKKIPYKYLILVLICEGRGSYGWYKIEMALILRGLGGIFDPFVEIRKLIQEKMVVQHEDNGKLCWSPTSRGEAMAQDIMQEYGVHMFNPSIKDPNCYGA